MSGTPTDAAALGPSAGLVRQRAGDAPTAERETGRISKWREYPRQCQRALRRMLGMRLKLTLAITIPPQPLPLPLSPPPSQHTPSPPPSPGHTPPTPLRALPSHPPSPTTPLAAPDSQATTLALAVSHIASRQLCNADVLNRAITSSNKMLNFEVPSGCASREQCERDMVVASSVIPPPTTTAEKKVAREPSVVALTQSRPSFSPAPVASDPPSVSLSMASSAVSPAASVVGSTRPAPSLSLVPEASDPLSVSLSTAPPAASPEVSVVVSTQLPESPQPAPVASDPSSVSLSTAPFAVSPEASVVVSTNLSTAPSAVLPASTQSPPNLLTAPAPVASDSLSVSLSTAPSAAYIFGVNGDTSADVEPLNQLSSQATTAIFDASLSSLSRSRDVSRGFVKCDGSRLIGTFDVNGCPRYVTVTVKPPSQPFECGNALLTYDNIAQLDGNCKWTGMAGKDHLEMNFITGVSIEGPLATSRASSLRLRGAGRWSTVKPTLSLLPAEPLNVHVGQLPRRDTAQDITDRRQRERQLLESGDPIIVIFGQSGVGKSTFINLVTSDKRRVGNGLQSCTSDISVVGANIGGKNIVIIDTPGIDNTGTSLKEADVLVSIAGHLEAMATHRIWVTGVLFLHRISDNKFSQTADRVSTMLKNLCGDSAMTHLTLCTTMWDRVPEDEGHERFDELCETGAWKEMIEMGAGNGMISNISPNAKGDAEKILSELIKHAQPVEVAIQDEIVNQGKTVAQTGAGKVLSKHLRETQAEAEHKMNELRETLEKEREAKLAKTLKSIHALELEIERLKEQAGAQASKRQEQTKGDMEGLQDRPLEERAPQKTQMQAQKPDNRQLQQLKKAERKMKELKVLLHKEEEAESARAHEAMSALQSDIEDAKRQEEVLDKPSRRFFWWLEPARWR